MRLVSKFLVMSLEDIVLPEDCLLVKTFSEGVGSVHVAGEKLLNAIYLDWRYMTVFQYTT